MKTQFLTSPRFSHSLFTFAICISVGALGAQAACFQPQQVAPDCQPFPGEKAELYCQTNFGPNYKPYVTTSTGPCSIETSLKLLTSNPSRTTTPSTPVVHLEWILNNPSDPATIAKNWGSLLCRQASARFRQLGLGYKPCPFQQVEAEPVFRSVRNACLQAVRTGGESLSCPSGTERKTILVNRYGNETKVTGCFSIPSPTPASATACESDAGSCEISPSIPVPGTSVITHSTPSSPLPFPQYLRRTNGDNPSVWIEMSTTEGPQKFLCFGNDLQPIIYIYTLDSKNRYHGKAWTLGFNGRLIRTDEYSNGRYSADFTQYQCKYGYLHTWAQPLTPDLLQIETRVLGLVTHSTVKKSDQDLLEHFSYAFEEEETRKWIRNPELTYRIFSDRDSESGPARGIKVTCTSQGEPLAFQWISNRCDKFPFRKAPACDEVLSEVRWGTSGK